MKRIYYILAAAALSVGATSCDDILDVSNTTKLTDTSIWSAPEVADGYVMAVYQTFTDHQQLTGINNNKFYDGFTDLFKSTCWDVHEHWYNKEWMLPESSFGKNNAGKFASWDTEYGRIKRTNLLLNSIDEYGGKFGEDWCERRRAEARFCNAINYWFLARVYGGVVIRTDKSGVTGRTDDGAYPQDCNRARVSEEETYKYILDELRWAIDRLPVKWEDAKYNGRATKGMAFGFMSRIALYAKEWKLAAEAADSCKYYGDYDLVQNYAQLFNPDNADANRKEIIYAIYGADKIKANNYDVCMRPYGDRDVYNVASSLGCMVPTAELADSYDFSDGTEFDWSTYKKKHSDPYTDREPRFHATILYNGAPWEKRTIETFVGATSSVKDGADHFKEWKAMGWSEGYTCTGYYTRKYVMENNPIWTTTGAYNNDIVLRYAEVLLNKAEALAQLGKIDDALVPLNAVRARVGLPARTNADAPDLNAFMKILRKERVCELAGEGHRFWDLRRWRMAHEVIPQPLHGVYITKRSTGTLTYKTVEVDAGKPRIYEERYYYFSIPAKELTANKLCVDNPGW